MRTMRPALRLPLLLAALLLPVGLAQSYQWLDVVQDVTILKSGGVIVDDVRTLRTDGDFGEAFICVKLAPGQRVALLDDSGALGPGPAATAFTQPCAGGTELVVKNERRVKERRVRFHYRLDGSLDYYSDVVQWYWQILEQEHPDVRGYQLTVRAPGVSEPTYDAYVHRFGNLEKPTVRLNDDRSLLEVSFDRIPDGDGVEIRYLMSPTLFDRKGSAPGWQELLEDEAGIAGIQTQLQADAARRRAIERFRRSPWWAALPVALLGITGAGSIGAYRRYGREPKIETMKYPFEPPSDLPPAAVTSILQQHAAQGAMGPAFHATIMDLMRRGYGEFQTGPKKRDDFAIVLKEADTTTLKPFEADVLEYLHAAQGRKREGRITAKQLKSYSQRAASGFMQRWGPKVRAWLESVRGGPLTTEESRAAAKKHTGRMLLAVVPTAGLAFLAIGPARGLLIAVAIVQILGAIFASVGIVAWRPEIAEEVYGWQGFKRTLTDLTRMKDAPLDFFQLWDVYYCYAAALGVAEKYLATLSKAAPLAGVDERMMTTRAVWLSGGNLSNLSSLSAMSSSISSLSSALSSASASASSGGSSSGGGGGGGGGSSGGR